MTVQLHRYTHEIINNLSALILSLLFFDFTIVGTREGTIISALCTGLVVKLFRKLTDEPVNRLVSD